MKANRLVLDVETGEERVEEFEYEPQEELPVDLETKEEKLERIDSARTIKELKEILKELL